ncbi:MAG: dienelactone hydrolase family protein [Roseiarcus sp.]
MSALRTFACRCFALTALSALASTGPAHTSAEELVKFDGAAPRLHRVEEPTAPNGDTIASGERGEPIQGYLTRPGGQGPFPAVVLLHTCLGLPAGKRSIGDMFARWGYVALFVDDFATRGVKETCSVDFDEAVPDAFGALAFLSRLPYVDPKRVAAVGWSQGADTALQIASSRFVSAFAVPGGAKFKAAAAFYPPCENQANVDLAIPTLVLVGASDDVTPAADCERLAKTQPREGSKLKLVVYPGARHGFDNPEFAGGVRVSGMLLEYDRGAAERSRSEIRDFLATNLAR